MALLDDVKDALRVTKTDYNSQISNLIKAAEADLRLVGVDAGNTEPLERQAIITYCYMHFYRDFSLKSSYDEQKAQLISASGYGLGVEEEAW